MIHILIEIGLGYVLWRYLPGKITAASPKVRRYFDLVFQIVGIIMMIVGAISLIKYVLAFVGL